VIVVIAGAEVDVAALVSERWEFGENAKDDGTLAITANATRKEGSFILRWFVYYNVTSTN